MAAEAVNYDRMNTSQLEEQATAKGLDLEAFQALPNNNARAQTLRDYDAAHPTDDTSDQATSDPDLETGNVATQVGDTGGSVTGGGPDAATAGVPYPDDASVANAQAAAAGTTVAEDRDSLDVPPVGGQMNEEDR